jgi:hypothetical protein
MRFAISGLIFAFVAAPAFALLARSREGSERQVGAFLVLLGAGLALRLAAVAARASSSR